MTTGCCVFARSAFGQQALSEAFRSHKVDKRYLALVEGAPEFEKLDVDARLLRVDRPDARRGPLAFQKIDDEGKRARTQLRVLARAEGHALVLAQPQTGRMHQIRVHLAHVGLPIVGDKLYGSTGALSALGEHQVGLHALGVAFPRPKGGRSFVLCPVEQKLAALVEELGIDLPKAVRPVVESFETRASQPPPKAPPSKKRAKLPNEQAKPRGGKRRGKAGSKRRR